MNTQAVLSPQFFLTAPARCPYLDNTSERKVFTHLAGTKASEINDLLTQGGFRRSQNIAYRPACEACRACVSVRILADEFRPTRSMKRIQANNSDIVRDECAAVATPEQYDLFRRYINTRHNDGGMADMNMLDYAMMVEDTHVNTRIIEYRLRSEGDGINETKSGRLVGAALTDLMADGSSMVYSFFDPDFSDRSFGTYMILDHIRAEQRRGLPHVYLGYWVQGSPKMEYKTKFLPQEHLLSEGWSRYEVADGK